MQITVSRRICSGVVPFYDDQVLLVRNSNDTKWGFPKGGVEIGLDKRESAAKEAYEEAGVVGTVGKKINEYIFDKDGVSQIVTMYVMEVQKLLRDYP